MLKAARCETAKCAMERQWRARPPRMHVWRRRKTGDYGVRLREKQKVKRYYGVLESQFRRYFQQAVRVKGNTGEALMSLLERRLDNVVYRLGFAVSRAAARQLISHGHIQVNHRSVDVASILIRTGDVIRVKNRPKSIERVQSSFDQVDRELPDYLIRLEGDAPGGQMVRLPEAEDITDLEVQTQLIVEFCSR